MQHLRIAAWVPIISFSLFAAGQFPDLPVLVKDYAVHTMHIIQSITSLILSDPNLFFLLILAIRYYRLVIHLYAYLFVYQADEVPANPTVTGDNVHVVISTIDPGNQAFGICVQSILENRPRELTIVTGGRIHLPAATEALKVLEPYHGSTIVRAISIDTWNEGNKRQQMTTVLDHIAINGDESKDTIVVFVDDHAWWNGNTFLAHLLAPLENPKVGLVGTKKHVRRERNSNIILSALNFFACIYLERHNFEITAQNAIDGGAFIISARTCAVRASIVTTEEFRTGFMNEHFFFGLCGPLLPDDDNYITRAVVRSGYETKFQNHPNAILGTTLGVDGDSTYKKVKKFHGQLLRWARSQWRSNTASLFTDRSIWKRQWVWTAHAGLITSLINYALFWDALIVYAWSQTDFDGFAGYHLAAMIVASKMVKLADFFWRNPEDIVYFPLYIIFTYVHTFYKLWALITFWDCQWTGRGGNIASNPGPSDDNDDDNDGLASEPVGVIQQQQATAPSQETDDSADNDGNTVGGSYITVPFDHQTTNVPGIYPFGTDLYYVPPTVESAEPSPGTGIFPDQDSPEPEGTRSPHPSVTANPSTDSATNRSGRRTRTLPRPNVPTPWGPVNAASLHRTPANAREGSPSPPRRNTRSTTPPLARASVRPQQRNTFRVPSISSISSPDTPRTNTFQVPSISVSSTDTQRTQTFAVPSATTSSSSSRNTGVSFTSSNSGYGNPLFGASPPRIPETLIRSPAPSPSPSTARFQTAYTRPEAELSTLFKAGIITAPGLVPEKDPQPNLSSPPYYARFTSNVTDESWHTRRQSEGCIHIEVKEPQVQPRTNFTNGMPAPPELEGPKIVFKKDRSASPAASGRSVPAAWSTTRNATSNDVRSPMPNSSRSTLRPDTRFTARSNAASNSDNNSNDAMNLTPDYHREFVRGDDCQRVHADGTYLRPTSHTVPVSDAGADWFRRRKSRDYVRPGSYERVRPGRRCVSPQPRYPVVEGRRY
ncbi:hypothetical protein PMZ80_009484 [Knufia obscura]|uniref:Ceramide glucosyltransferase n=1 Tax=Knufia obscura TaxID=1635080 RepID=A0ABR0RE97_9EURO|nr:hypothetical protein PMZ80_009484 [Knufia obscura]